ncbi:ABC transporter ATP-binding protein [Microlunatus sp. GCM10028923]|uniref:ABC transporter ATP-binding protein n=1 Tax=Microlunatus sp. GCM10028923 TaxID=3273400 RepID=UPI00360AB23D
MNPSLLLRLWPRLIRQRLRLLCYLAALLLAAGLAVTVPLVFQRLVDDGLLPGRVDTALRWTGLALGISVLAAAANAIANATGAELGARISERLRAELFARIQTQPYAFHAQSKAGAVVSRLTRSPVEAQGVIQTIFGTLVGQGVLLITAVITLARIDLVAVVMVLAMVPLFLLPMRVFTRRLFAAGREQTATTSELEHFLTERCNVEGAVARHLYQSGVAETSAFTALIARLRMILIRRNRTFYGSQFLTTTLAAVGVGMVYGAGAINGASVGQVVAMAALVKMIYDPLIMISIQGLGLSGGLIALEKVFELLDLPAEPTTAGRALPGPATRLTFDGVWFRHPAPGTATLPDLAAESAEPGDDQDWAVTDLSFALVPGGITALVGASGAGKTTTAMLAAGIHRPTRGRIMIDGLDLAELSAAGRHRAIGMVTQDVYVLHASLRDNLTLARPGADDDQLRRALARAQLAELVDGLPQGLDTVVGDRGFRLSGGERQRLSLARMFLAQPDIVILDEATAHLDALTEAALHRAITEDLAGRTLLIIAHRPSTIENADRTVRLVQGRLCPSDSGRGGQ